MNFEEQFTLAIDDTFIRRVQQAAITAAIAVSAEELTNDATVDGGRLGYATLVLRQPEKQARTIALSVVTNPAIHPLSTDSDIQFTVNIMWDALSGVRTPAEVQALMASAADPAAQFEARAVKLSSVVSKTAVKKAPVAKAARTTTRRKPGPKTTVAKAAKIQ
jgi:hypothetical protein